MNPRHPLYVLGLALALHAPAQASGDTPHPMIDFTRLKQAEPLEQTDTSDLQSRRATYAQALADMQAGAGADALEHELLEALLFYDEERIRIVEMIPSMIEIYEVDAELEEDMLNFRRTMRGVIAELRHEATTLQRYKPYDFRVGMSYLSLMSILQQHEQLHERMRVDQQDASTLLGRHRQQLSARYRGVEDARGRLEREYRRADLRAEIDRIDRELQRRRTL